jgi:hypothetical protein
MAARVGGEPALKEHTALRIPQSAEGRYQVLGEGIRLRRLGMCTCGHSEKDHAPCGKCLVEGCECEVFERKKP